MIVYSPFYFQFFFWGVHKLDTQLMCTASHWNTIFHWNMTYWHMFPGYSTFQQVYTRYILHIAGIPTYLSLD